MPTFGVEETLNVPVTGNLTIKDGDLHDWAFFIATLMT